MTQLNSSLNHYHPDRTIKKYDSSLILEELACPITYEIMVDPVTI